MNARSLLTFCVENVRRLRMLDGLEMVRIEAWVQKRGVCVPIWSVRGSGVCGLGQGRRKDSTEKDGNCKQGCNRAQD